MTTESNSSKKHLGFTIQQLRKEVTTSWQLTAEAQDFMRHYFLRRWHTANLLALLKDGCLNYEGTRYQIIWVRGKVIATAKDYCFLSFRKPRSSSVYPVVMITAANAPSNQQVLGLKSAEDFYTPEYKDALLTDPRY